MSNTYTYRNALEDVFNGTITEQTIEKLKALDASLANKAKAERGATPTQLENEKIKNTILSMINTAVTVSAVVKAYNETHGTEYSVAKFSALLNQLVQDNSISKEKVKKTTYFAPLDFDFKSLKN